MSRRIRLSPATFTLVVALIAAAPLAATSLRTAHDVAVTAAIGAYDAGFIVTAGAEGKVLVWDTDTGALLRTLRVSDVPVTHLALYPDGRRLAVFASDGRRSALSVWDWRTGAQEFVHIARDAAISMEVSPAGTYVLYTTTDRRSIQMLDGTTGSPLPFLRAPVGIIGWTVTASSESRVLTYAPASGALTYRTITTGAVAGEFTGPRNLTKLSLLSERRFAVGRSADGRLAVIDLLSGATADSVPAGEIASISTDAANGDIIVVSTDLAGRPAIRRYRLDGGRLRPQFGARRTPPEGLGPVVPWNGEIYAGTTDGSIIHFDRASSSPSSFATARTERISDLAVEGARLDLLLPDSVLSISTDLLLYGPSELEATSYVRSRQASITLGNRARFIPTRGLYNLIWTPEDRAAPFNEYRGFAIEPVAWDVADSASVTAVAAHDGTVALLNRNGEVRLIDRAGGDETFTYRAIGIQGVTLTDAGLFVAKAGQGGLDAAVLRISPTTGETVPLPSQLELAWDVAWDGERGYVYAIGIRTLAGKPYTVIERFADEGLGRRREILALPGEYLNASIVVDSGTGDLYTTLDDRGGILQWDGRRLTELARSSAHIPDRIHVAGMWLVSVNRDGSVSLIDRATGNVIADLYVLRDTPREWVAILQDGFVYASSPALLTPSIISTSDGSDPIDLRAILAPERLPEEPPWMPRPEQRTAPVDVEPLDRQESGNPEGDPVPDFDPESGYPAPAS